MRNEWVFKYLWCLIQDTEEETAVWWTERHFILPLCPSHLGTDRPPQWPHHFHGHREEMGYGLYWPFLANRKQFGETHIVGVFVSGFSSWGWVNKVYHSSKVCELRCALFKYPLMKTTDLPVRYFSVQEQSSWKPRAYNQPGCQCTFANWSHLGAETCNPINLPRMSELEGSVGHCECSPMTEIPLQNPSNCRGSHRSH